MSADLMRRAAEVARVLAESSPERDADLAAIHNAVSDWLAAEAELSEQVAEVLGKVRVARTVTPPALAVALAYLGAYLGGQS